jgi:hypothetical protein
MKKKEKKMIDDFQLMLTNFPNLLNALAWHSHISEDGQFRRMERNGVVKMFHVHDDYSNEMRYRAKTRSWKCSCGQILYKGPS